jgi:hypothetical protein
VHSDHADEYPSRYEAVASHDHQDNRGVEVKELHFTKVTSDFGQFSRPIILEESKTFRTSFYCSAFREREEWHLRGELIKERIDTHGGWHKIDGTTANSLKGGELAKLVLKREQLAKLRDGLNACEEMASDIGLSFSRSKFVVGKADEMLRVDANMKAVIQQLINDEHGKEFWDALSTLKPDLTAQLADANLHRRRCEAVDEFKLQLEAQNWKEREWEHFFKKNEWIFGLGLRLQYLSIHQNQADYGGVSRNKAGAQVGDFLMTTEAASQRFTVLVEIKRPDTRFFSSGIKSRNGVPGFSEDFANALSQIQVNARTWEIEGSRREQDAEELAAAGIRTISPRGLLICGHTRELDDGAKRTSFELFRRNLISPDVVTFDELLARAEFITEHRSIAASESSDE